MSEPRIEPGVRISRFLLDDILRASGLQWSLTNTAAQHQMTEPWMAEIMACLYHVGGVELCVLEHRKNIMVYYEQFRDQLPGLCKGCIRAPLTRWEAAHLIDEACDLAETLNQDLFHPYTYRKIYLFGSCLTDKPNPGDVDLGVEIHYRDAGEIPEPSYIPFSTNEVFHDAARHLIGRGNRRKVSIHDRRELKAIGAPFRLIWSESKGRVDGKLVIPPRKPETENSERHKRETQKARQDRMDAFIARVKKVTDWPQAPALELDDVKIIPHSRWLQVQQNETVLAYAHLLCMPESRLKVELASKMSAVKLPEAKREIAIRQAKQYIKACLQFNPWILKTNGRMLRRGGAKPGKIWKPKGARLRRSQKVNGKSDMIWPVEQSLSA